VAPAPLDVVVAPDMLPEAPLSIVPWHAVTAPSAPQHTTSAGKARREFERALSVTIQPHLNYHLSGYRAM
jgi:hypothetical protein